jgi:hypothetical protein
MSHCGRDAIVMATWYKAVMARVCPSLILMIALTVTLQGGRQQPNANSFHWKTLLHAHNCYPERGEWSDRIERALATGLTPIAIEQDVMWAPAAGGREGRSVVAHDSPPTGQEPSLEEYFFAHVQPLMERALRENRRSEWPLMVLHLDFKSNERAHHEYIWRLLQRHESWLTTAPRVADVRPQPMHPGPLLVLTENGEGQERVFSDEVPIGGRLLLFGTVPPAPIVLPDDPAARAAAMIRASASTLIPSPATNYRRWSNHSWAVVEQGGQSNAGAWSADDDRRLRALVSRAHEQGLWIRFYTLNGYGKNDDKGWSDGYNFGSASAVEPRWRAAMAAGVDFVATDQYEAFASILKPFLASMKIGFE